MVRAIRLGMLTPSSNTVLEPVTTAMIAGLHDVSLHFSRFAVTEISLREHARRQFDEPELMKAAVLLAHAKVSTIAWNGTSSGWLGFERDKRLCEALQEATGIPACTSVLALNEILENRQIDRIALVSPYVADVQQAIMANYRQLGVQVVAEAHLDLQENFAFACVDPDRLRGMLRAVAASGPQAIVVFCTNLCGAPLVLEMEAELGIPIFDTVATALWKSLRLAGADVGRVRGWGCLFG